MARFNLAVLMLGEGRKAEAKEELRRVRADAPDFPHLEEALKELEPDGGGGEPGPKGPGANRR